MEEEPYIEFKNGKGPYISDTQLNQLQKLIKIDIKNQVLESLNAMQDIIEKTQKNITTGKEFETNVFVDGKRVFGKRINCGQLPNSGQGNRISTGLTNVTYVGLVGGFNPDNSQFVPCNIYFNSNLSIGAFIENNAIRINNNESGSRSGIVYVTVYYTKN